MKKTLDLVASEEPIWASCQGEGILAGMPSVFVRTHGCSFSCSWCDTKGSWRPGSRSMTFEVRSVLRTARAFRLGHAVVTGGDPLEQLDPTLDLIVGLAEEWCDESAGPQGVWRPGMHVTLETQGAIYDENVSRFTHLLSISPKLHDWRQEPLDQYVQDLAVYPGRAVQVKVVCCSADDAREALDRLDAMWRKLDAVADTEAIRHSLHLILQPESSGGRGVVKAVWGAIQEHALHSTAGVRHPAVRVLPQMHKAFGFK